MDFTTLQTEVFARGYDYLNDGGAGLARAKRWINQSYLELCTRASWPFLKATTTGTAPLTIADLRAVLSVVDTTNVQQLFSVDRRWLMSVDPALTSGTPTSYYLESATQIKVWPVQAVSLSVNYLKTPAQLSAGGDTPLVPDEWCDVIVDGAVLKAEKDNDQYDQLLSIYETTIGRMVAALLPQTLDNPGYILTPAQNF